MKPNEKHIDKQKSNAPQAKELEEKLRLIYNTIPFPIALVDTKDENILFWSQSAKEKFGHTPAKVSEWYELAYPDPIYRKEVITRWKPFLEKAQKTYKAINTGVYNITCKDGSVKVCELYAQFIPGNLIVTFNDITDRQKAEEELKESEEKYRSIFENAALGIFRSTPEGKYEEVNKAFATILGFDSPEKMVNSVTDIRKLYKHFEDREKIKKEFAEKGFVENYEVVANHPYKETVWILINAKQLQHPDGHIYYEGTVQDITEKKLAELKLQESKEEISRILENTLDGILLTSPDGSVYSANPEACKMFGRSEQELCEIGRDGMVDPSDPRLPQFIKTRSEQGKAKTEIILLRKDGSKFPAEVTSALFKDKDGNIKSSMIIRDITDREDAEKKLRQSEERFKKLSNLSFEGIMIHDNGVISDVNQSLLNMFGYSRQEVIGKNIFEIAIPREYHQVILGHIQRKNVQPYEIEAVRKDGTRFPVEIEAREVEIDDKTLRVAAIRNITDRKKAEKSLKENEEYLRSIFKATPVGIGTVSSRILETVNEKLCKMVGYTKDELLGKNASMLYPSHEDYEYVGREKYRQIKKYGTGTVETRFKRKDGKIIHVLLSSTPTNPNKQTEIVTFSAMDITDLKHAEQELRASEETYRNLFQNAQVGLFRTRIEDGKILESNEQLAIMFGYENREKFINEYITSNNYVDPGTREKMVAEIREKGEIRNFEARFYRKDRTIFWSRYSARIFPDKGWIEGVAEDITKHKQAEKELEDYRNHLEELVEERTEELEKQNEELERFNQLFVGREFRLKELRDKVKELEKELEILKNDSEKR